MTMTETEETKKVSSEECQERPSQSQSQSESEQNVIVKEIKLPSYPKHGVIGESEPDWLDIFHSSRNIPQNQREREDFKKQKFDFYEFYEKPLDHKRSRNEAVPPTPIPGLNNMWRAYYERELHLKTSDVYDDIDPNLPTRFKNPGLLKGYGWEKDHNEHPLFQTTSSSYGKLPPTIHDVPHEYHGLKNDFTAHLTKTGMPKNRSLNIK